MKASSLASIRPLQFSEEVSDGVLFFIDESFQEVAGTSVGALGAVAIPADQYNRFCGWVYRVKKAELGATELADAELKGNSCFARAAFRKARTKEGSSLLRAVDDVAQALDAHGAKVFALWTSQPELLTLRKSSTTLLTTPYVELLHRFKRYMRASSRPEQRGALFLDQIGHRQDMWAACSLQNYMVRTRHRHELQKRFVQVPHFTHSAVSPGLQAADLVAYLAAQQHDPAYRSELGPWWERFERLAAHRSRRGRSGAVGPLSMRPPATEWREGKGSAGSRPMAS